MISLNILPSMIQCGAYIYVLRNSVHDFGVKMYFSAFMFSMIELSFCINDSGDTELHSAYLISDTV